MIRSDHSKYNKPLIMLYPGEHYVSSEDVVLSTVAGVCLVVTLFDVHRAIGGMGHFVLPGLIGGGGITSDEVASYGITQLEYLFGEFVKLGGNRKSLQADVFGATVLDTNKRVDQNILKSNINFIHAFFSSEKIPINHLDLSDSLRRKVVFYPKTGKTYRKILTNNETESEIIRLEKEYIAKAFHDLSEKTRYVLFTKDK